MKNILKLFVPPLIVLGFRKLALSRSGWSGVYHSWETAESLSTGYDSKKILEKIVASSLKVKSGEVAFERDGVVFDEVQYSWPLLAGLMYGAAINNGILNVLDYGGSLGSTYYQNKNFLYSLKQYSWSIVEQEHFVEEGKRLFSESHLQFFHTSEECFSVNNPNVLLFSSVIQYLKNPYDILVEILNHDFDLIIFDRTPFVDGRDSYITLQSVPEEIYKASYPCWIFNEGEFFDFFEKQGYSVIESFISPEGFHGDFCFKGMILEKENV